MAGGIVTERDDRREQQFLSDGDSSIGKQLVAKTSPKEAFEYYSGYKSPLNVHPVMYAAYDVTGMLVVVGYEFYQEYPVNELDKALAAYKELLRLDGYIE